MQTIGVIAFGHIHFKAACEAEGLDWREVVHVSSIRKFRGVTRVIVHCTAHDRRQSHLLIEAIRLRLL